MRRLRPIDAFEMERDRASRIGSLEMKVLVADDVKVDRMLASHLVTSWGYEPLVAKDGVEALGLFLRDPSVQLAIVDWEMPKLDGLKVIEKIKRSERFVYALIVTSRAAGEDLERALNVGADDYLSKPFQPVELRARLASGARLVQTQTRLVQAQKLEAIGGLAAGVAHEINTPAQYVGDNVEFLEQSFAEVGVLWKLYQSLHAAVVAGSVPPELIRDLQAAIDNADIEFLREEIPRSLAQTREGIGRVTKIVQAMKEFSHPGSAELAPVDLNRLIESTVTVARNEWKYVADLELDLQEDLPPVPCLAGEFNQVVLNILMNAAHALSEKLSANGGKKGQIVVRSRQVDDDRVLVSIADDGPGIPAEIQSKVFEPFFTTKAIGKGTGQGLAIAHSVVVGKHHGRIWLESSVGRGTEFSIELPLQSDGADASGKARP